MIQIDMCEHCPLRARGRCFAVEANAPRFCELVAPDSPRREAYTKFLEDRTDGKPIVKPETVQGVVYPVGSEPVAVDGAEVPPDGTGAVPKSGGCGCGGKERPKLDQERPKVRKAKPKP